MIETLIEKRDVLQQQLKLMQLKQDALQKRLEAVVAELRDDCPHEDIEETSSYHGGGYDYVAETCYRQRCRTCDKTVKAWSVSHPGIYG